MALIHFISLLTCLALVQSQACYDSNGVKVVHGASENSGKTWAVCPGDGTKTCCLDGGDSCFSQGVCYSATGGSFYRGMCTDASWNDSTCPQVCKNLHLSDGNTWTNICDPYWCCAGPGGVGHNCCDDTDAKFDRPVIQPLVADAPSPVTITKSAASNTTAPSKSSTSECVDSSIAIGLGAGLGAVLVISKCIIAWLVLAMRKQASRDEAVQQKNQEASASNPVHFKGYGYGWPEVAEAMNSPYVAEAPGNSERFEIPS